MKKVLVLAICATALLVSCLKTTNNIPTGVNCTPVAPAAEEAVIKAFTGADSFHYTKDTSYIYYHIVDSGSGPSAYSTIFFTYKAMTLDGHVIGQSSGANSSPLVNLIAGFQAMKRFYKEGTRIVMVIPSYLAYSCEGVVQSGNYVIQPNTILYYDLTITSVQ